MLFRKNQEDERHVWVDRGDQRQLFFPVDDN